MSRRCLQSPIPPLIREGSLAIPLESQWKIENVRRMIDPPPLAATTPTQPQGVNTEPRLEEELLATSLILPLQSFLVSKMELSFAISRIFYQRVLFDGPMKIIYEYSLLSE